jgi:two-component system, chemotaxis family, chemotaxis protein CheY
MENYMSSNLPAILIVDDSATTRAMIKRVIGMTHLPVGDIFEAADGKAALDLLESHSVELVLADLNMPVMDGMEMISRMRKSDKLRSTPVIVISAQPDEDRIGQLKRDGVVGYLPKPFTAEAARDLIGPHLVPKPERAKQTDAIGGSINLTLIEAFAEALETMAFISPELPEKNGLPAFAAAARLVRVCFHGQGIRGSLALAVPPEFGSVVAVNCGTTGTEAEADDALKELANVTCGLLLRRRVGGATGFELAPPIMTSGADLSQLFSPDDSVVLNAGGFLIAAHVTTDSPLFGVEGENS